MYSSPLSQQSLPPVKPLDMLLLSCNHLGLYHRRPIIRAAHPPLCLNSRCHPFPIESLLSEILLYLYILPKMPFLPLQNHAPDSPKPKTTSTSTPNTKSTNPKQPNFNYPPPHSHSHNPTPWVPASPPPPPPQTNPPALNPSSSDATTLPAESRSTRKRTGKSKTIAAMIARRG